MSVEDHKRQAPSSVCCKIITVSDTRTEETDRSGALIKEQLTLNGHTVGDYVIVKDERGEIESAVLAGCEASDIQAILINGGTGIAARDVTIETLKPLFTKEITGFGELFRMLSYTEDIGSAAILSRAAAGVVGSTAVFAMPGSTGAAALAMKKLILPEVSHVIREINKDL
ncbi:molybdopterin adenylyltransferase [Bacillus sp. OV194]|nr:molybdopterin adenylyltransferase [Bacillus sp. OV194]